MSLTEARGAVWVLAAALLAVVAGAVSARMPMLAMMLMVAIPAAAAFAGSPWVRVGGLIALALFAFGSSSSLNLPKLAFIALLPVTVALGRRAYRAEARSHASRNLLNIQMGWFVYLLFSMGRSLLGGNSAAEIFRDSVPYLAWSLALLWAVDLAQSTPSAVRRTGLLLTAAGSVGTGLTWIGLRGGAELPAFARLFPSTSLAALGVLLAAAVLLNGGIKPLPLACLLLASTGLILTGTRTLLIVPVAMLVMVLNLRGHGFHGFLRCGAIVGFIAAAATVFPMVAGALGVSDEFLARRGQALSVVLQAGVDADASGDARLRSYAQAWHVFQDSPLFGQGPGYLFTTVQGIKSNSLDTPLTFLAKFGLVGLIVLSILVVVLARYVRSLQPGGEWRLATLCFGVFQLLYLPFGGAFDDKGLGLAVTLLLAGVIASSRQEPVAAAQDQPHAHAKV